MMKTAEKERPILFSAPMVRAILDGTKTQTRRIVKLPHSNPLGQWEPTSIGGGGIYDTKGRKIPHQGAIWHTRTGDVLACPYGQPGDRLWVKETWRAPKSLDNLSPAAIAEKAVDAGYAKPWAPIQYEADKVRRDWNRIDWPEPGKTRVSIHMPRWASRILLEVTGVRVERLQDISEADAQAEGCPCYVCGGALDGRSESDCHCFHRKASVSDYRNLWEQINGPGSWDANPWVWVIEFKRVESQVLAQAA